MVQVCGRLLAEYGVDAITVYTAPDRRATFLTCAMDAFPAIHHGDPLDPVRMRLVEMERADLARTMEAAWHMYAPKHLVQSSGCRTAGHSAHTE